MPPHPAETSVESNQFNVLQDILGKLNEIDLREYYDAAIENNIPTWFDVSEIPGFFYGRNIGTIFDDYVSGRTDMYAYEKHFHLLSLIVNELFARQTITDQEFTALSDALLKKIADYRILYATAAAD